MKNKRRNRDLLDVPGATAQVYSNGASEIVLGKAIKQLNLPREEIVVMTKVRQRMFIAALDGIVVHGHSATINSSTSPSAVNLGSACGAPSPPTTPAT